jgi:hypothetical protein
MTILHDLDNADAFAIAESLEYRANMIETGDPILSRKDVAEGHGGPKRTVLLERIALLTPKQTTRINRLRQIAAAFREEAERGA